MKLRVTAITWETEAIRTIELRPADAALLPVFAAGSHVDVHLPTGLVRSYSLMNPQHERHRYVLGVAQDAASRGGSSYIHGTLRVGDMLTVGEPRNLFPLSEKARRSVLIGGGIGVTPMLCMAERLHALDADWVLHYAVRSHDHAGFCAALAPYGDHVRLHVDAAAGGVLDIPAIVAAEPADTHFYCCGPKPMMASFTEHTRSVDPACIHVEYFAPVEDAATDGGFLVELAKTGRTVAVGAGRTILETLLEAGLDLPSSCQQGVCGVCETAVLSGLPDHRDSVLTAGERAANKTMMICCSGSLSERLVLDI